MAKGRGPGAGSGRRCPECGVVLKEGAKRCDFCGTKVETYDWAELVGGQGAARPAAGARTSRVALDILKVALAVGLVVAAFVVLGKRLLVREPPPPVAQAPDGRRQASAACEERIRSEVRPPFRIIAFRTALVSAEPGGFVVSGAVDLQSLSGETQRKRYWCSVREGAPSGMAVSEGRLY